MRPVAVPERPLQTRPVLTPETALDQAKRVAQAVRARAPQAEALRQLPQTTLDELQASGLFGIAVPREWGGSELLPDVWLEVIAEIAAACGSSGWVYGVLLGHMWLVSQFPFEAQAEVFSKPDALVASLIRLGGSAPRRVPGGYRWQAASGRFCSGVDFADWVVVGGTLQSDDGPPEGRWFLIPREDIEIEDDWFTSGLKGTGSKSIRVPDAFIPEHRSVSMQGVESGTAPGRAVNPGELYALPGSTWTFVLSATPIGIARGAVGSAREALSQRLERLPEEHVADQSANLERFARACTEVDIAHLLLQRQARRLVETLHRPLSPLERTIHRRDIGYAVQHARHAVNVLYELGGGSSVYETAELQRQWRDVNAAAAHFGLQWEASAIAFSRAALGLPPAKSDRRGR